MASSATVSMPRIVVVRGGAIGDFILTLPVLAALRAQFPQCRIEIIAYRHIANLALVGGFADEVRPIESRALAGFFGANSELDEEWGAYFARCALIISFLYDPDGIFRANVERCTKAQYVAGPHRPDESGRLHATAALLQALERLAIFDADPVPRLRLASVTETVSSKGSGRRRRVVALHPGSGSEQKNWPESEWTEFVEQLLMTKSVDLLVVGGEAEGDRLDRLQTLFGGYGERFEVAKNLPLVNLAERLSRCAAFVGHDSGITHLAAAVGLPGLVLWGPSQEQVWRPRSERMVLLRAEDGLANLSVSTVVGGLLELLALADNPNHASSR